MLRDPSDVVRVQRTKSPEVMDRTAKVLSAHGFEKESRFLSGKHPHALSLLSFKAFKYIEYICPCEVVPVGTALHRERLPRTSQENTVSVLMEFLDSHLMFIYVQYRLCLP